MSVAERLGRVRDAIAAVCAEVGRDPASVGLVAVGKTWPLSAIEAAAAAGQVDFGESYGQELRDKAAARPDLRWHYIGRIQLNKAKYVAPVAFRIHTLETDEQAEALVRRAAGPLSCLVAVNIGREPQKSGVLPEEALDRCHALAAIPGIAVVGLMCLPPADDDPEASAPHFAALAELAARGRADGLPLHELSMGMSHDWPVAIRHGATWIRVGTAIFGSREA